jgi:hypothetical protein
MKRLIGAALALSLLGATAASAAPYGSFAPLDYRDHYRHHDDGNGAAIAAGIGFLALTAILASQHNHDRDEWRDRDDWRDRDRDYGYRSYNRGYGYAQPYQGYRGW